MSAPNMKIWKYEHGIYTSPVFHDDISYTRVKRFFIRSRIIIDADDKRRIIKVQTSDNHAKGNFDKLKRLGLL